MSGVLEYPPISLQEAQLLRPKERYLPTEILSKIFLELIDMESSAFQGDPPPAPPSSPSIRPWTSFSPVATVLERVCRRWRDIIRHTPRLWTNIKACPRSADIRDSRTASLLEASEKWLARSGKHPLVVVVRAKPIFWRVPERFDSIKLFFAMLCRQSARWKEIEFVVNHFDVFPELDGGCFPILESLTIRTTAYVPGYTILRSTHFMQSLKTMPNLRSADIEDLQLLEWILPWSQLTSLRLNNTLLGPDDRGTFPTRNYILNVLSECSNLRTLRLSLFYKGLDWPVNNRVVLPHLQTMTLQLRSPFDYYSLMRYVDVPQLCLLQIVFRDDACKNSVQHWDSFRRVLPPHIPSLRIFSMPPMELAKDHPEVHRFNRSISSILLPATDLRVLECRTPQITPDFLKALLLRFSPTGRLLSGQNPGLLEIRVVRVHFLDDLSRMSKEEVRLMVGLWLDVIESRWWLPNGALDGGNDRIGKVRRLEAVDLELWGDGFKTDIETVPEDLRARYRALRDDGFRFSIKNSVLDLDPFELE